MINKEQTIEKLKKSAFKITSQRLAIIEHLDGNKTHPTADSIYNEIKASHLGMSFATVYNTLEALVSIGEIQELSIGTDRKHFDPDVSSHHHIVCTDCSKISDVHIDYSLNLTLPKEVLSDFELTDSQVQFKGLCTDCR